MTKDKTRIFARKVAQLKPLALKELANVAGGFRCLSCCGGEDGCKYQPDDSDDL